MASFWKLVQNENMKIYRRVSTWIMLGITVAIPLLVTIIFGLVAEDNNANNWGAMMTESEILFLLVMIFSVVKSAESVAGEFSRGTIKLLLIRPWSRASILLSKFIAILLFALLFTAVSFAVTWLANVLAFGYTAHPDSLIPSQSPLAGSSPWLFMLRYYLDEFIVLAVVVSFGFMLSAAFRSSGLAIGLSLFLLFAGSMITGLLMLADQAWIKFVLFPHLGLTTYLNGSVPLSDYPTTYAFSLGVLAVYFIVFNAVSWTAFIKRDVSA
ncbi:ABC transporter permease [Cohnella sp. 56]|uniref:ABC transporter permease n=1 Tax=Cohnella sp. 56 TaxID=3113722 RepID=UPI0030E8F72B